MRPTQILLSGAEELGKNNKYVASRGRVQIARPFLPDAYAMLPLSSTTPGAIRGNYANRTHLGTLATPGALSVSHLPQTTPTLKTSDETRTIPTRRHERHGSTNGRCILDLWGFSLEDGGWSADGTSQAPLSRSRRASSPMAWPRTDRTLSLAPLTPLSSTHGDDLAHRFSTLSHLSSPLTTS